MSPIWKILNTLASWTLQGILVIVGLLTLYVYASSKPTGLSWRCHFGLHDWERFGHRRQCRRCGGRKNDSVGLHRLKMRLDQLRMSINQFKGPRSRDWQTPRWLYDQLNERYGPFNLDPCTSEDNPLGTEFFFTEKEDGLKQDWLVEPKTRFYMNPPYGRETKHWVKKAHEETSKDRPYPFTLGAQPTKYISGVGLLPVRTDPKWFHEYILPYYEIIFLPGRIAFIDPETEKSVKGTNFASMLVIYR